MIRLALLVARRELRVEWRTRVVLWQVIPFGVMSLLLCALAVGPDAATERRLAPGLFYIVEMFLTLLVINRAEQRDGRKGTRTSSLTLGLDPAGLYLGRALAMWVQLVAGSLPLLAAAAFLFHVHLGEVCAALPLIGLTLATLALAGVIYGALVSGPQASGSLLPILALPAFAPVLIAGERGFSSLLSPAPLSRWVLLLGATTVAYLALGVLLYGVVEES